MKVFKEEVKTETVKTLDKKLCDKCNDEIRVEKGDAFECYVELKTGYSYFDGGAGEEKGIDLCPSCAGKLFDKLEGEGYRVNKVEWDY